MSLLGFQRRRRLLAAKQKEQEERQQEQEQQQEEENEQQEQQEQQEETAIDKADIEDMDIEQVRSQLDNLGVTYPHNTGLPKLKERLADAIS